MRAMVMLVAMLAAAPAGAQEPARPGEALLAGWQRIDAHTLRRVDIKVAAADWQRVDAHRWRLIDPGAAPREMAAR